VIIRNRNTKEVKTLINRSIAAVRTLRELNTFDVLAVKKQE
jgi:hypothetical protein